MRGRLFYPLFVTILFLLLSMGTGYLKRHASGEQEGNDFVYICRDAGAGGYEAFPDVCRLTDGRLMAVFYAGYGHVSLPNKQWPKGGRVCYSLSSDDGRTWTRARLLYDGPDDDRDPSIVQLKSGRLLCNFFSLRKAEGKPWQGLGTWLVSSDDLGKTWSRPQRVSPDYYCSSPIRELPDGRLVLGLYREEKDESWGAVILSEDGGKTWGQPIDINNGGYKLDAETDVLPLKDGSLYAIQREPGTTMCYSVSKDGGRTWSVSKPIGFPGHCPYLLRTKDDIIILAHRLPQTSLHYSLDECRTWSENVPVDDFGGAYPSMVNLKDGSVLIIYYEEGEGSNIRARRFRATPSGIEWLSFKDSKRIERRDRQADWGAPDIQVTAPGMVERSLSYARAWPWAM
jgi:sialidase-1